MIVVSDCLTGVKCRYNGTAFPCGQVIRLVETGEAVSVCPEILGGLATPRSPAEIVGEQVLTIDGENVSVQFHKGAEIALQIALNKGCTGAILKSRSPSCGVGQIYDGSFSGRLKAGSGIFTRLLVSKGISVRTEEDCHE